MQFGLGAVLQHSTRPDSKTRTKRLVRPRARQGRLRATRRFCFFLYSVPGGAGACPAKGLTSEGRSRAAPAPQNVIYVICGLSDLVFGREVEEVDALGDLVGDIDQYLIDAAVNQSDDGVFHFHRFHYH
jgi:hypothetical protein